MRPERVVEMSDTTNPLIQLMQYLRVHAADVPNLEMAIQVLECLLFIQQNEAFIRYAIAHKHDPSIYTYRADQAKQVLRAPNGLSFHVVSYDDPEVAIRDYRGLIKSLVTQVPFLMAPEHKQIARIFVGKIKESTVGCLEARLADAFLFLADPTVLKLNQLMQDFFSGVPAEFHDQMHVLLPAMRVFFQEYLNQPMLNAVDESILLTYPVVKQYVREVMGYSELDTAIQQAHFVLASQVVPEVTVSEARWTIYYYRSAAEARHQLSMIRFLIEESQPEIRFARVQMGREGCSFRLTTAQHRAFETIRCGQDLLAKVVRSDEYCFIARLAGDLTHSDITTPRTDYRPGARARFTVYGEGVVDREQGDTKYLPYDAKRHAERAHLSRHTATTLLSPALQPHLFGLWGPVSVGVMVQANLALIGRIFSGDVGTVSRCYDAHTCEAAQIYYKKEIGQSLFPDLASLKAAQKGQRRYNEVLAYIHWDLNSSCIGIFSDNLESRAYATFYARVMRAAAIVRATKKGAAWDERYEVPMVFYLPGQEKNYRAYTRAAQQTDEQLANEMLADVARASAAFKKNEFGFLLIVSPERARQVLDVWFDGQPILIQLIRRGLFPVVNELLQRAEFAGDVVTYLNAYVASHPRPFLPTDLAVHGVLQQENKIVLLTALLEAGALFNAENKQKSTLLYEAAWQGLTDLVEILLRQPDMQVNQFEQHGNTSLYIAARGGQLAVVEALLRQPGVKVNQLNHYGDSPLHIAAWQGHLPVVQRLILELDIEVNQANDFGVTPLYIAAQNGHVEVVNALLRMKGMEVNKADKKGASPLCIAAQNGHVDVVNALLDVPSIQVNQADEEGASPLYIAAQNGHFEVVDVLLRVPDIQVNQTQHEGATPLHIAAQNGHLDVVNALLRMKGIEVSKADKNGASPLYIAAKNGHLEILRLLTLASLDNYLRTLSPNPNTKAHAVALWGNYTHGQKRLAVLALLTVLEEGADPSSLADHVGALRNGRLGQRFNVVEKYLSALQALALHTWSPRALAQDSVSAGAVAGDVVSGAASGVSTEATPHTMHLARRS